MTNPNEITRSIDRRAEWLVPRVAGHPNDTLIAPEVCDLLGVSYSWLMWAQRDGFGPPCWKAMPYIGPTRKHRHRFFYKRDLLVAWLLERATAWRRRCERERAA